MGGNPFKKVIKIFKRIIKAVANIFTGFMGAFGMSFDTPEFGGGADFEAQQQGITVNKQSNVAGIPVVYGHRKVGGVRVFVGSKGDDNKYLYVCLAVAEGEINAFKHIYINDEKQSISNFAVNPTDGSTVDVSSDSKYYVDHPRAKFQFFTGKDDQQYSRLLGEHKFWNDKHRLRGVAYVACRFEWVKPKYDKDGNQTKFDPWQGIPTIQVEIEGKKVLSGDYSSHGTTEANTYGSETGSFVYSNNPADCMLDFLRNPRYGKGLKDHRINFAEFRTAQQLCSASTNFGTFTGEFLNCNTYLRPEDTMFNNAKKLLQTCRGFLPYVNGQYELKIEVGENDPTQLLNITDDMIIGTIGIQSQDKNSKYNQAKVTFNNADKDFESDTAVFGDTNFLAEDDGEDLILNIGAPGITNRARASVYAEYMVKRSRKQMQVTLRATSEAQDLVAGDLVCITHRYDKADVSGGNQYNFMFKQPTATGTPAIYSDPEKIFRVISQKLNYDGTVDLILMEHQNNIYPVTQQQEDRDLSPIEDKKEDDDKNDSDRKPGDGDGKTPDDDDKHFTVAGITTPIGVNIAGMKTYTETIDAFVDKFPVRLTLGTETQTYRLDSQNAFSATLTTINGTPFKYNDQVQVNISKEYGNGNVYAVEKHIVTIPANPNNLGSGGI